jgi:hypothetical protein
VASLRQVMLDARTTVSHRHPLRVVSMWLASEGGFSSSGADDSGDAGHEATAAEWTKMESDLKAQHARKGAAELQQILSQAKHDFQVVANKRREKARKDQEAADAAADSMSTIEKELFTRSACSHEEWSYVQKHQLNSTLSKLLGLMRVSLPLNTHTCTHRLILRTPPPMQARQPAAQAPRVPAQLDHAPPAAHRHAAHARGADGAVGDDALMG